jgi:hypothetical protein
MKKVLLPVAAALLSLAGTAFAAEFQPMGALGIGGAGVARTTNAMAGYWNPAGLAFNEKAFSIPLEVSVGLRVSKGLADNVDKISKFTEKGPNGEPSTFDNLKTIGTGPNPTALGDVVSLLSILKDIETQKGTVSMNGNAVVAVQIKHFSFGAFGNMEGFAKPDIDTVNVLPSTTSGSATPVNTTDIATAAAGSAPSSEFFTDPTVRSTISTALLDAGFTALQATDVLNNIDARLAATSGGGTGINIPAVSQAQAADAILNTLIPALTATGTASIDNNRTAVVTKSLAYIEFPISYGHPINLGRFGKLGIGASIKPIMGRVYSSELTLIKNGSTVDSDNITDNLTKNFKESTAVTFDLGAFYKYSDWLNVGLVAKNLTSPKFDSPELKDQHGNLVTTDAKGNPINAAEKVTLKPQVRAGVSLEPLSWLTVAADLDLTENETVLSGLGYKSRTLGGGLELHPLTWFKVRGGMYKNLSNNDIGPVATAGLTFGTKWVNLDLDGAYGLETARYKEKSYPKEARVQLALNIQF